MRPSRHYYDRFDRHARRLTVEAIRTATDAAAVAALEARLRQERKPFQSGRCADLHGLWRVWTRAELGGLIAEATNRGRQLAAGDPRRPKGPALDPARIPDDRLDWLIQHHRDMAIVDAMRAERRRRTDAARSAEQRRTA